MDKVEREYAIFIENILFPLIEVSIRDLEYMINRTTINGMPLIGLPYCYAFKKNEMKLFPKPNKEYEIKEIKG